MKNNMYFKSINVNVLDETFKNLSGDTNFSKSKERLAKLAAQLIDMTNSLIYLNSGYCTRSPEYIFEKKEILKKCIENKSERIRKTLFWLNRVCKNTVGSPFLMVKIMENDVEQIANICSDYLDYIGDMYKSMH